MAFIKNPAITNRLPENIAKKIDYLINNKGLAENMGKEAYNYVKKFEWEKILKRFEEDLREVIE